MEIYRWLLVGEMIMKRPMFIGPIGCGKTTLLQRINNIEIRYNKTQTIEFYDNVIDTPGEYIEHRRMYTNIATTAMDAGLVVIMQSVEDSRLIFPEAFSTMFGRPVVGIVTKTDLANDQGEIELVASRLKSAGARRVFNLSSITNKNVDEFLSYLKSIKIF